MAKKGRTKRREEWTSEEDRARQEGRQRRVYRVGHSWLVGLPRWARARLDCLAGGVVYLHDEGREEIVLAPVPVRAGGRPSGLKLERDLAEAKRLIAELQTQRGITRDALFAEWDAQRAMRHIRIALDGVSAIGAINERLARIEDHLGYRRGPWHHRPKRGRPRVETAPGPDAYPGPSAPSSPSAQVHEEGASPARHTPAPSPSPVSIEEGADTSGAQLPGVPLEH